MKLSGNQREVTIVDYGMGNIRSLSAALEHLGHKATVSGDPRDITKATTIILPGVGSFPAAMEAIRAKRINTALVDALQDENTSVLGICLGMQLLMTASEEDGGAEGLGIIEGSIGRFPAELSLPVPHIGFNAVLAPMGSTLFKGLPEQTDFYFVHAYRALTTASRALVATSDYGEPFVSAFELGNVYGTQFHPEKSQSNGLRLLQNFLSAETR